MKDEDNIFGFNIKNTTLMSLQKKKISQHGVTCKSDFDDKSIFYQ